MKVQVLVKGETILKRGKGIIELPQTKLHEGIEWPEKEGVPLAIADVFWDGEGVRPQSQEARDAARRVSEMQARSAEVSRDLASIILSASDFDDLKEKIAFRLDHAPTAVVGEPQIDIGRSFNGVPLNDEEVIIKDEETEA